MLVFNIACHPKLGKSIMHVNVSNYYVIRQLNTQRNEQLLSSHPTKCTNFWQSRHFLVMWTFFWQGGQDFSAKWTFGFLAQWIFGIFVTS